MNTIKVTAFSSKGIIAYYVSGIKGQWEQTLVSKLNGTKTEKGSLKFLVSPCTLMSEMGINYEYADNTAKDNGASNTTQNVAVPQNTGAVQQQLDEKVWKHNGVVYVRTSKTMNDTNLKEAFKLKYSAKWDKTNKYWKIENSNLEASEVELFLGIGVSQGNGAFVLSQAEAAKIQAMLNHVIQGGTVTVA